MQFLYKNIKAQSQIITTVLLILITLSAVVILIQFIVPFVEERMAETECIDLFGSVSIKNNPRYTCYDDANNIMRVQVSITKNKSLEGFKILINSGASSQAFGITGTGSDSGITMYKDTTVILPGEGEEQTYNITFSETPQSVQIYPILTGGKLCEGGEGVIKINPCA